MYTIVHSYRTCNKDNLRLDAYIVIQLYSVILFSELLYSCFEKGCLKNGEKLTQQCRKLLWVMVVFTVAWVNLKVFQRGGRKQHKHVFILSRSLLMNHLEPQSSKAKLLLPIMPIGIVAYAFTLLWDNLCRNSCMHCIIQLWLPTVSALRILNVPRNTISLSLSLVSVKRNRGKQRTCYHTFIIISSTYTL